MTAGAQGIGRAIANLLTAEGVPVDPAPFEDLSYEQGERSQAAIKRDGKKDLKPSSVEVSRQEAGPVIVYLFPRSNEVTRKDKRLECDAKILRLRFTQSFRRGRNNLPGKIRARKNAAARQPKR